MLWTIEILQDLSLRLVSNGYPILHSTRRSFHYHENPEAKRQLALNIFKKFKWNLINVLLQCKLLQSDHHKILHITTAVLSWRVQKKCAGIKFHHNAISILSMKSTPYPGMSFASHDTQGLKIIVIWALIQYKDVILSV